MIELLVAVIVVGVLAGAMLLTQRGSEASAQAAAILNDLRLMKVSVSLFLNETENFSSLPATNYAELLGKYMDHGRIVNDPVRYAFYVVGDIRWVGVRVDGAKTDQRVNAIIERKAVNSPPMPLYGSAHIETPPDAPIEAHVYQRTDSAVWTVAK
jgi:hypothetical protein